MKVYPPGQVDGLYLMMGQGLERLASVPAGCVCALGGLDRAILKTATLASSPACRPLAPMLFQVPSLPSPPSLQQLSLPTPTKEEPFPSALADHGAERCSRLGCVALHGYCA